MIQRQTQTVEFWSEQFSLTTEDFEYLNSLFIEGETPLTTQELTLEIIKLRVEHEENAIERRLRAGGDIYRPIDSFKVGQRLVFPALNYIGGDVAGVRAGYNPDQGNFRVLHVTFEDGREREFASELSAHPLNEAVDAMTADGDILVKPPEVLLEEFGMQIARRLEIGLRESGELVRLAGRWFPSGLLIDVNVGHLNLAEAMLDMIAGGPLPTDALIDDLDLPADVDRNLQAFSLDYALQRDSRFDEVGPAGKVMWYLRRYEPPEVLETPQALRYTPADDSPYVELSPELQRLAAEIDDELGTDYGQADDSVEEVTLVLISPHVQSGTLPMTARLQHLFPTAYAAPQVRFDLIDHHTGEKTPGWVVRAGRYVFGLAEWYQKYHVQAGSYVKVRQGKTPGEVVVEITRQRPQRDWLRTAVADGDQIHFTMSKQPMHTIFEDESIIIVPDETELAALRDVYMKRSLASLVRQMFSELGKLNQQSRVHAKSLYMAVNVVRRCPPELVFAELVAQPYFSHVGDAYWRLNIR